MINFRYHLVSLVAVFLALAIGIVAGSTVIKESILDSTQKNLDQAEKNLKDLESTNEKLNAALNQLKDRDKALADGGSAQLLANKLTGTPVLLVQPDGIDTQASAALMKAITDAGGVPAGTVTLSSRVTLTSPDDVAHLRDTLSLSTLDPDALRAELAARVSGLVLGVAERRQGSALAESVLSGGALPTSSTTSTTAFGDAVVPAVTAPTTVQSAPTTTTTLPSAALVASRQLRSFLTSLDSAGLADVSLPDQAANQDLSGLRLLVVSGAGSKLDNGAFVYPLLQQLAAAAVPVTVAAESTRDGSGVNRGSFVGPIRGDGHLRQRVSTVDDAEWFVGWAAAVLAIEDLGLGHVGQYGVGAGAERLLPTTGP